MTSTYVAIGLNILMLSHPITQDQQSQGTAVYAAYRFISYIIMMQIYSGVL